MDSHGAYPASVVDLARFATAFDPTGLYPVLTKSTIDQLFAVPAVGGWIGWFVVQLRLGGSYRG